MISPMNGILLWSMNIKMLVHKSLIFLVFGILVLGFVSLNFISGEEGEVVSSNFIPVYGEDPLSESNAQVLIGVIKDDYDKEGNLIKGDGSETVAEEGGYKLSDYEFQFDDKENNVEKIVIKNLVIPNEEGEYAEGKSIITSNTKFDWDEGVSTFTFNKENGKLKLGDDIYKNIKPQCGEVEVNCISEPVFIELDEEGEINKANFVTDEKGNYTFAGTTVFVPANSRVTYDKKSGIKIDAYLDDVLIIEKFPELKEGYDELQDITFVSKTDVGAIKFPDDSILAYGEVKLNSDGYVLGKEADFIHDKLRVYTLWDDFLVTDKDISDDNLNKYNGYFKKSDDGFIIKTDERSSYVGISVLEGNEFFGTDENSRFEFEIPEGNQVEFFKHSQDGKLYYVHSPLGGLELVYTFNGNLDFTFDSKNNIKMVKNNLESAEAVPMVMMSKDIDETKLQYATLEITDSTGSTNTYYSANAEIETELIPEISVYPKPIEEPPVQTETPNQVTIKDKIKEVQGLLYDTGGYSGYYADRDAATDGIRGKRTNAALTESGIDDKSIANKYGYGTEEYYNEVIAQLEEVKLGQITEMVEEEEFVIGIGEDSLSIQLNQLGKELSSNVPASGENYMQSIKNIDIALSDTEKLSGKYSDNIVWVNYLHDKGLLSDKDFNDIKGGLLWNWEGDMDDVEEGLQDSYNQKINEVIDILGEKEIGVYNVFSIGDYYLSREVMYSNALIMVADVYDRKIQNKNNLENLDDSVLDNDALLEKVLTDADANKDGVVTSDELSNLRDKVVSILP